MLKIRTILALAVAILLGSGYGVFHVWRSAQRPVHFEPVQMDAEQPTYEGDVLSVNLTLVNTSPLDATLTEVETSCGCTELSQQDGKPIKLPLTIAPNAKVHWNATISTVGRVGALDVALMVRTVNQIGTSTEVLHLHNSVRQRWGVVPAQVTFRDASPGERQEARVLVMDSLSDPGLEIKDVVSSDPDHLQVTLRRWDAKDSDERSLPKHPGLLHTRYALTVSMLPRSDSLRGEASITIVPKDYSPRRISVHYTMRSNAYHVQPEKLVITANDLAQSNSFSRRVWCSVPPTATSDIRLLGRHEGIELKTRSVDKQTVELQLILDASAWMKETKLVFGKADGESLFEIPILLLKSPIEP